MRLGRIASELINGLLWERWRIVLGPGGSGKSTLAARIGEIAGLPVIELDKIFWQENLTAPLREEWIATQQRLARFGKKSNASGNTPFSSAMSSELSAVLVLTKLLTKTPKPARAGL